uniref:Uncharacterized protein n=1 Tax=Sphaerodactylus townsendi TaxID=933632 RepID=A0ACB8EVL0_9SAUR
MPPLINDLLPPAPSLVEAWCKQTFLMSGSSSAISWQAPPHHVELRICLSYKSDYIWSCWSFTQETLGLVFLRDSECLHCDLPCRVAHFSPGFHSCAFNTSHSAAVNRLPFLSVLRGAAVFHQTEPLFKGQLQKTMGRKGNFTS